MKLPDDVSFEEAAAIPIVFVTALHSLSKIAKLSPGESVLIHAGAGGVGQAAIQIAKLIGAEIFTTVSTDEKRKYLMDKYQISEDHIFSSRDLHFANSIMRLTNNHGVDVVLNSLSGEALHRSWNCIAPFGRFIELGKRDIVENGRLKMGPFLHNVIYAGVDIVGLMAQKTIYVRQLVEEAFSLLLKRNVCVPGPLATYSHGEIEAAFRKLQSGQGMGKIVVTAVPKDIVFVSTTYPRSSIFC